MAKIFFPTVGEFFGQDLSDREAEILQIERFGGNERVFKKHFKKELRLYQTKWFDYRVLHPVVATYLYAAEYRRLYKKYFSMTVDCEKAKYVRGFSGNDAWKIKNAKGFTTGRQQADSMGIPYWFYISKAYESLYQKKWQRVPIHTHLYSDYVIDFIGDAWAKFTKETLVVADLEFFRDQENQERPEFQAHQQWLLDRVAKSKVPVMAKESLLERGFII